MKSLSMFAVIFALLAGSAARAQTMPLNTGFNHDMSVQQVYPTPAVYPPAISTIRDEYWINIASYPPTNPPVDRSFAIFPHPIWSPALPGSLWISARNTYASAPGIRADDPGYTIFRKCFCLVKDFKNAQLNFQVRADDNITVWLNTTLNQVLAPSFGNFSSAAISKSTTNGFKAGKGSTGRLFWAIYPDLATVTPAG
jgi:hypothetical protein